MLPKFAKVVFICGSMLSLVLWAANRTEGDFVLYAHPNLNVADTEEGSFGSMVSFGYAGFTDIDGADEVNLDITFTVHRKRRDTTITTGRYVMLALYDGRLLLTQVEVQRAKKPVKVRRRSRKKKPGEQPVKVSYQVSVPLLFTASTGVLSLIVAWVCDRYRRYRIGKTKEALGEETGT